MPTRCCQLAKHSFSAVTFTQQSTQLNQQTRDEIKWQTFSTICSSIELCPAAYCHRANRRRWRSGWWRSTTRIRGHFNDNLTPTTRPTTPFLSKLLCLWKKGVEEVPICIVDLLPVHLPGLFRSDPPMDARSATQPQAAIRPTLLFLPRGCYGFCKLTIDDMQRDGYRWTVRWAARIVPGVFFPCRFDDQWANLRNWIWNGKKI